MPSTKHDAAELADSKRERRPGTDRMLLPDLVVSVRAAIERYGYASVPYGLIAELLGLIERPNIAAAVAFNDFERETRSVQARWDPAALREWCDSNGWTWEVAAAKVVACHWPPRASSDILLREREREREGATAARSSLKKWLLVGGL